MPQGAPAGAGDGYLGVPCNLLQHYENLVAPFHIVILRRHCVRRHAAAKTSSAGMSLACPRSYFAIRLANSTSQAA